MLAHGYSCFRLPAALASLFVNQWSPCPAAVHTIMLNSYGGYLPNNTIDTVSGGQAQFLYGNGGGPAFHDGNYPQ